MIRINPETNTNTPIPSTTEQTPAAKSYLLNQPIKDSVSFGDKEKPKKQSGLVWILAIGAATTGLFFALKSHKKVNTAELEKTVANEAEKVKNSSGSGHKCGNSNSAKIEPNHKSTPPSTLDKETSDEIDELMQLREAQKIADNTESLNELHAKNSKQKYLVNKNYEKLQRKYARQKDITGGESDPITKKLTETPKVGDKLDVSGIDRKNIFKKIDENSASIDELEELERLGFNN